MDFTKADDVWAWRSAAQKPPTAEGRSFSWHNNDRRACERLRTWSSNQVRPKDGNNILTPKVILDVSILSGSFHPKRTQLASHKWVDFHGAPLSLLSALLGRTAHLLYNPLLLLSVSQSTRFRSQSKTATCDLPRTLWLEPHWR
jgi:hypothetical protein